MRLLLESVGKKLRQIKGDKVVQVELKAVESVEDGDVIISVRQYTICWRSQAAREAEQHH